MFHATNIKVKVDKKASQLDFFHVTVTSEKSDSDVPFQSQRSVLSVTSMILTRHHNRESTLIRLLVVASCSSCELGDITFE